MLIALYQRREDQSIVLQSIAATPFRCKRALVDPVRDKPDSLHDIFQTITGWPGIEQELRPGQWPKNPSPGLAIAAFDARNFQRYDVNGYFLDNLLCSLPECLPHGSFDLNFGCLLSPKSFVHLIIGYDETHQLVSWVERRYQPTMDG